MSDSHRPAGVLQGVVWGMAALSMTGCSAHKERPADGGFKGRAADWRNGAIVYQVIVDRFAPPANLEAKRHLYPAPKKLRAWGETPKAGELLEDVNVWSHEIDFWGGDLQSLRGKLDYVQQLGVDVLYLNPIHLAYTNHKYDALDYFEISPEYGTRDDLRVLADDLHGRGMKLVLDGVFNHMGKSSPWFQEALADANSPWREWFYIDPKYELGYRAWANVPNLPEVRLESPTVQARLYGDPDSAVQGYLRDGADGWRLDVAFDLGFDVLTNLTRAAHKAKPGSLVVGEIWNYPEQWMPALDGVLNFHVMTIIRNVVDRKLSGAAAGRLIERMIADTGIEAILKSWIVLDNHDIARLHTAYPDEWKRRMAQVLQFTLPGCPCIYYGSEVGMEGEIDPEQRGPMRWDLVSDDHSEFRWMGELIAMRRSNPALQVGDFRLLDSEKLLAFMRRTDRVAETTVVVANATDQAITEALALRDSKLMNWAMMKDRLSDEQVQMFCGTSEVSVPARTIRVYQPVVPVTDEYTPYKRVP